VSEREPEVVVVRHDPCPWLPAGGRADVVLSAHPAPEPTAVVRLLVTWGEDVWVVPRADGAGLDLPAAQVTDSVAAALDGLLAAAPVGTRGLRPWGFVRNTVTDPPFDYPWPAPVAHFAVWHGTVDPNAEPDGAARTGQDPPEAGGRWLGRSAAAEALGERHWWPLHRQAAPGSVISEA
jgi:hypothetical protein